MRKLLWVLMLFVGLSTTVNAASYTYDFSTMGYSDGQNLEGMVLNSATFTSEAGDLRYYANYGEGVGTGYNYGSAGDIYISFSEAVNSLSIRAGDGAGDNDAFSISLFEFGTNNLLGTFNTPVFGGANEPEWYTLALSVANIGKIIFDPGNSGILPGVATSSGGVVITDMQYNTTQAVPEPATILLLGAGLVGLVGYGRKKFNK